MMTVDFLFLPKAAYLFIFLSKFLTGPLPTKRVRVQLKDCALMMLSLVFFHPITARRFRINSRFFSCALYSDDSSRQASDEKLRRCEHLNQSNKTNLNFSLCCLQENFFGSQFICKSNKSYHYNQIKKFCFRLSRLVVPPRFWS